MDCRSRSAACRRAGPGRLADGTAANELVYVDLMHIALTAGPANRSARITSAKASGALVVPWGEEIAAEARRRDPDVDRHVDIHAVALAVL